MSGSHTWHQLVYAISGVLTVYTEAETFVITPDQAVWLPTGVVHRVGSLLGAVFRSLWIGVEAGADLPKVPTVFMMSPSLQALIIETTGLDSEADGGRPPIHVEGPPPSSIDLYESSRYHRLCRGRATRR